MSSKSPKKTMKKPSVDAVEDVNQTEEKENGQDCQKNNGLLNQTEEAELKGFTETEINDLKSESEAETEPAQEVLDDKRVTRSKSSSPHVKPIAGEKAEETDQKEEPEIESETKVNGVEKNENEQLVVESDKNGKDEVCEMGPLVLEPDEQEPELQFDENSDMDSGKNSPVISRCMTRRSQIRSIPTPKTPKLVSEQNGSEKDDEKSASPTPEMKDGVKDKPDLTESSESCETSAYEDGYSTQVEVGSDSTRINFTTIEPSVTAEESSSFMKVVRDQSLSDTLRGLSSRRSIHTKYDYSQSLKRSDLNLPYPKRASVESISGLKRKNRSLTPEESKRAKHEPAGIFSYVTSPVFGVKSRFNKELPSSTPKLTGFRNKNSLLDSEELSKIKLDDAEEAMEKKWCSIM